MVLISTYSTFTAPANPSRFPDSEKPRKHSSWIFKKGSGHSGNFLDIWKVYGNSGNFSGRSGKFTDNMECFRNILKVFGNSGKFTDTLENFWTIWKVSGQYAMFLDPLESVQILCKYTATRSNLPYFIIIHIRLYIITYYETKKQ